MITINFDKAKAITKDRLRAKRTPLLQAQDIAFQRALELNADTTTIIAEKQRLRDLPTLADACTTLDELKVDEFYVITPNSDTFSLHSGRVKVTSLESFLKDEH
jgi:hypothetical protein